MKISLISFLLLTLSHFAIGQSISKQVIGTAGTTQSNSTHKLSWTIGQPVVGLMTGGETQLGNGYYPSMDINALSTEDFTMDVAIKIYPNPVTQYLFANQKENHKIEVSLFDISGKLLMARKINSNEAIDVSPYTTGIYLIEARDTETNKKNTYKIIKK